MEATNHTFKREKVVVGLDIGTTKICAIVGQMNEHGKLEILGMGQAVSEGVMRGMVVNINSTVTAIKKAIEEASAQSNVEIGEVNVGIAGQHIKSVMQRGHIIRQNGDEEIAVDDLNRLNNDMHNIVMPFGNEIIHVMPQLYSVDYQDGIKDPVGMPGTRLEADFHIISAQTKAISNINKCVVKAGLEIEELILEPIASSLSVLSEEEMEAGVVLVDIGGGTTDVAIFYDNIIRHTAVIPFGGNVVTSDIQIGLNLLQKQAELLKVKYGQAIASEVDPNCFISVPGLKNRPPKEVSMKNLAHIISCRMEEIIEMVQAEVINSGFEDRLSAGIVITGGGARLKGLKQLFELNTGLDARIGFPNEHLGKGKVEEVKSPMYATGVGLVLAGFNSIDARNLKYDTGVDKNADQPVYNNDKPSKIGGVLGKTNLKSLLNFLTNDLDDNNMKY